MPVRRFRPYIRLKLTLSNHRRPWTQAERQRLLWLAAELHRDPRMTLRLATKFGRSPKAIRDMLRELGWRDRFAGGRTLRQVAAMLGLDEGALLSLVRKGRFIDGIHYHARPAAYCIQDDELWAWMDDMRSWHYWDPERLTDPVWREHFTALRRDWITTAQAAAILCVCTGRVLDMRQLGYLPGEKPTNRAVWFRRSDVLALKRRHLVGGCYLFVPRQRAPGIDEPAQAIDDARHGDCSLSYVFTLSLPCLQEAGA